MTDKESIRHFETQQKRYKREHDGNECPHYTNAISAMRERIERNDHTSDFDRHLAEQLKDPEFKREWELQQQGWIPIEDRLPNGAKNVLIYIPFRGSHLNYVAYMESGLWYVPTMYGRKGLHDVTHWMPLPELPKMDGDTND